MMHCGISFQIFDFAIGGQNLFISFNSEMIVCLSGEADVRDCKFSKEISSLDDRRHEAKRIGDLEDA